jgi:hypothetical protein
MERLPSVEETTLSIEQRHVYDELMSRSDVVGGPFAVWLRSADCLNTVLNCKKCFHERLVYDMELELKHHENTLGANYQRGMAMFGEQVMVELVGAIGYYTMLALTLKALAVPGYGGRSRLSRMPQISRRYYEIADWTNVDAS